MGAHTSVLRIGSCRCLTRPARGDHVVLASADTPLWRIFGQPARLGAIRSPGTWDGPDVDAKNSKRGGRTHPAVSTNPTQIASVIRFHLGQMKVNNAHHDFEHLCRQLARLRVYSNVIPATGPVSAGGDGGRDFETYRMALSWPLADRSNFAARSSGMRAVAFACSLDGQIESKIRSDVRSILAKGAVDEVVVFCEADLAVAKRHALQRWSKTEYDLELQIFDGQAVSELLADRETLWIAHEYLRLPAELTLPGIDRHEGYEASLAGWQERLPIVVNHADFLEIKWALRHATFDLGARANLNFWLRKMEAFIGAPAPRPLQRAALYEVSVATLRGTGELDSEITRVRDFMSDFDAFTAIAELQDTATLLVYVTGAQALGQVHFDAAEPYGWRKRLVDILDREIAAPIGPGRRAGLLSVRGFVCIVPEGADREPPVDDTFVYWNRMMDDAEQSPQFPIEEFTDHLSKIVALFGSHVRFADLAERADALLSKRSGAAIAAEKIFERALAYYKQDKLLDAVRELCRVQAAWFTGDTMARFQKATYLMAQCYGELRCAYAAKYHALIGAYIARYSDDPEVKASLSRMLFAAADAEDAGGNSLGFVTLLARALDGHVQFDSNPLDGDEHPDIAIQFGQVAALRGLAMRAGKDHAALIDDYLKAWPEPLLTPIVQASEDPTGFWARGSMDETWAGLQDAFLGRPFGDVGPTRTIVWRALGVRWSVSFSNTHAATALFERFVTEAQIALVALAGVDLCLLPLSVHIELTSGGKVARLKMIKPRARADDVDLHWALALPSRSSSLLPEEQVRRTLPIIGELIRQCSTLPNEDLFGKLEEPLETAANRIFIGRLYEELYAEFMPSGEFRGGRRRKLPIFGNARPFETAEHPLLAWIGGPGPTYSAEVSTEAILGRYRRGMTCAGQTARRLLADPATRSRLEALHRAGVKDWELLSTIANAVVNTRVNIGSDIPTEDEKQRFHAAFDVLERAEDALDPALFNDDFLTLMRRTFQAAFLSGWGLVLFTRVLPHRALEAFLIARYGLRSDDQPHANIFEWQDVMPPAETDILIEIDHQRSRCRKHAPRKRS